MRFSRRTGWDPAWNELTRRRRALEAEGTTLLDLTESNPTRCGFDYPAEAILPPFADSSNLTYDPDPKGLRDVRARLAADYGPPVDAEDVVLAPGTSEAYSWLFKLLADPGDEILVPTPSYPLFEHLARLEEVRPVPYPLVYDGRWRLDVETLAGRAGPRTRAVVVVHPNNPTGSYLDGSEREEVVRVAASRGLAVIADEVFLEFLLDGPPGGVRGFTGVERALTFTLGGLSKSAGLPQMKLAWIVAGGPAGARREALARLELVADTYLSVGTPVQHAFGALREAGAAVRRGILARVRRNRERLVARRGEGAAWDCLPVEGGWSAVLRLPEVMSDEAWALRLLEEERVVVHPGYFYDFPPGAFLVVSLLPPETLFDEAAARIASRITRTLRSPG